MCFLDLEGYILTTGSERKDGGRGYQDGWIRRDNSLKGLDS